MRKIPTPGALWMALALALLAASASAQQVPTPQFTGEVVVREVLLDVLVTDGDGNVVVGLGDGDFVVEEDGEPVRLESVAFYSNRRFLGGFAGTGASAAAVREGVPDDRYFVLFYYWPTLLSGHDRGHILRLGEAGRRSFEWVVEELLPNDHVAVVSFDTGLRVHQDFTRDRNRLGEAIRRATGGKVPKRQWTSRAEVPMEGITLSSLPQGEELRRQTADIHDGLRRLAEALGEIPGRKNLIVFGADLPVEGSLEWQRSYPPMVQALNTHNVAAYTIGVSGTGRQGSLLRLAEDTGADYAYRFQSFLSPLRKIAQESSGYYLLSYRRSHGAGESGYQQVTVRTTNPEFQVKTRSGYRYGEGP